MHFQKTLRLVVWCLFLVHSAGCLFTDPIAGAEDTIFFGASCECLICDDPAEPPGFCNSAPTVSLADIDICLTRFVSDDRAFDRLFFECQEIEDELNEPGSDIARCNLAPISDGEGVDRFIERGEETGVCELGEVEDLPTVTIAGAPGASTGEFNSTITATGPGLFAFSEVAGTMEFTGGNCSDGSCPIDIHRIKLRDSEFDVTLDGEAIAVTDGLTYNTDKGSGTCAALDSPFNGCAFMLDAGTLEISVTGVDEDDTRRIVTATNVDEGGGIINHDTGMIAVDQTFVAGEVTVEFGLSGVVDNFAPRVSLPGPQTVACGHQVALSADVDVVGRGSNDLDIAWLVNGRRVARDTETLVHDYETGLHTVEVLVKGREGSFEHAVTTVDVLPDTTAPRIEPTEPALCMWPPDHGYRVLSAEDAGVMAVDDCDPNPRVKFVRGASSQPDNAIGDGNTSNDLVVNENSVCLRSERTGGEPTGRNYAVEIIAIDSAGNTSEPAVVDVHVPHDQRPSSRCDVAGGERVPETDPRCEPPEPLGVDRAAGCAMNGSSGTAGIALLCCVLFALGRRRLRTS